MKSFCSSESSLVQKNKNKFIIYFADEGAKGTMGLGRVRFDCMG